MGKMIRKKNAGTRRLMCRLTEPEKGLKRRELVGCCGVILDIEVRLESAKATVRLIKEELGEEQGRHDIVARCLVEGQEERSIEFDDVYDYDNSRVLETVPAERLGRLGGSEVVNVRDMRADELNQTLAFVGEEVQDASELKQAVVLYFNRAGKAERVEVGGEEPDTEPESAAVPEHPVKVARDLSPWGAAIFSLSGDAALAEARRIQSDLARDGYGYGLLEIAFQRYDSRAADPEPALDRVAAMRDDILRDPNLDLNDDQHLHLLICALGHWVSFQALQMWGHGFRAQASKWADCWRRRHCGQEAAPMNLPVTDGAAVLEVPPEGLAETDEQLSVALLRAGYFLTPQRLAAMSLPTWESLRHFAAMTAAGQRPPPLPIDLDDFDLIKDEVIARMFATMSYLVEASDAAEWTEEQVESAIEWAAVAWHAPAESIPEAPAFLAPFAAAVAPGAASDATSAYEDLVHMAPAALDEYLQAMLDGGKEGLDELRKIAQGLAGASRDADFYARKTRQSCAAAIVEMLEDKRQAVDGPAPPEGAPDGS